MQLVQKSVTKGGGEMRAVERATKMIYIFSALLDLAQGEDRFAGLQLGTSLPLKATDQLAARVV